MGILEERENRYVAADDDEKASEWMKESNKVLTNLYIHQKINEWLCDHEARVRKRRVSIKLLKYLMKND